MADQKYTLTQKRSVRGSVKDGEAEYVYEKGDIISQKQYDALTPRHKDQFEKGAVDLLKKNNPKDTAQDSSIAELTERVEALETAMNELTGAKAEEKAEPKTAAKK